MNKTFSKPNYSYELSTADIPEAVLKSRGFIEMQYKQPGPQYIAQIDGTWAVDTAKAFSMLRAERNKKLSETDYLMTSDYPITEERRSAVAVYRQALRDITIQEGAPWDGVEHVPWPVLEF